MVLVQATRILKSHLARRTQLMAQIEAKDVKQLRSQPAEGRE